MYWIINGSIQYTPLRRHVRGKEKTSPNLKILIGGVGWGNYCLVSLNLISTCELLMFQNVEGPVHPDDFPGLQK